MLVLLGKLAASGSVRFRTLAPNDVCGSTIEPCLSCRQNVGALGALGTVRPPLLLSTLAVRKFFVALVLAESTAEPASSFLGDEH